MAKPKTVRRSTRFTGVRLLENGKWAARYTDPDGREREKLDFEKEREAHSWRSSKVAEVEEGRHVAPQGARLTVRQYAAEWQNNQLQHRAATTAQINGHFGRHVLPVIGDKKLTAVKRSDIQAMVRTMTDRLAPSTIEVVYAYVAMMFRSAVTDRLIAATPCRDIKRPRIKKAPIIPLERAEVRAIVDAVPDRYRALVIAMAGLGLRRGEACGLTVDRVDFLRDPNVKIDRQLVQSKGGPVFGPPKTEASSRIIPMPSIVKDALAAHLARYGEGPDRLIFTDESGRPIRGNRLHEVFKAAVDKGGVRPGIKTTPHDLRHYYASLLIFKGKDVAHVAARLGHRSTNETHETYIHLWPNQEDATREAVDEELGQALFGDAANETADTPTQAQ